MSDERWYFSKEELENSPSRKCGIDADKELNYKQLAANLIHDMGSRKHLSVNQLCISTAMVYMHRFYVFHSFTHFQWNAIAMASLFLAAKVEEQTRKLEHVIKVAQWCMQKSQTSIDCSSESYLDQVQELVMNENILLQTLGFDVAVKHPHAFIVEFSDRLKMNKDITKTMYGMASNSLHVTTMCVQYKPSVVACFCIHFVCKWSDHVIQLINGENRPWWTHIDPSVTPELLEQMTEEFLAAFDKSPLRLKNKVQELLRSRQMSSYHPFNGERKPDGGEQSSSSSSSHTIASTSSSSASSTSTSHLQKHHQPSISNHSVSGPSRVHKSSAAHLSNHHPSSHSAINPSGSSSSLLVNGNVNANPNPAASSSQFIRSNSAAHVSSSQQQQQQQLQRHPQHQQHHHHRHHAAQMSSSSQHAHKPPTSGANHNVSKPKINPVAIGHSTSNGGGGVLPTNELTRPDRRKITEIRLKPGSGVRQEPGHHSTAVASIPNHRRAVADAATRSTHQKIDPPREFTRLATSSRMDIISNVIKEVAMAKQNEKRTEVKAEPLENEFIPIVAADAVDSGTKNAATTKPSRNHSIFSPSPDHFRSSPAEERILPTEVQIKQEPLPAAVQIKQEVPPVAEVQIKQEVIPDEVQIKRDALAITPSKRTNRQHRSGMSHSELIPVIKKVETVSGFEDIFRKNAITVTCANEPPPVMPKITNIVSLVPRLNDVIPKEEPCEVKTEPAEYSSFSSANSQLPLVPNSTEGHPISNDKIDTGESSSTSHSHKKKKKHKEKDKRHKDKKRHKEDKHHHRKEHSSREKERKEPGPIKITIPKEKLTDIPMKLKIKINKDLIVTPSTSTSEEVTSNDVKVKSSSEKVSKSRKRKRESDHDHSSKKVSYNVDNTTNSQNGYKDCL